MSELMDFECMSCSKMFSGVWHDISKRRERVIFNSPQALDEIEVLSGEGIGVFCSGGCHQAGRSKVMREEGVPIPPVPPDLGPVESCAKCKGPVDMSDWHLMYTEGVMKETSWGIDALRETLMAAVCKKCSPSGLALAASAELECPALET